MGRQRFSVEYLKLPFHFAFALNREERAGRFREFMRLASVLFAGWAALSVGRSGLHDASPGIETNLRPRPAPATRSRTAEVVLAGKRLAER